VTGINYGCEDIDAFLVKALARKAREGTLSLEEVTGSTITVSNLGMYGVWVS